MPKKKRPPARAIREPIQVYLDQDERGVLDRLAAETGLSRAEILRRGLRRFAAEGEAAPPMLAFADALQRHRFPEDMAQRHDDYLVQSYLDDRDDGSAA